MFAETMFDARRAPWDGLGDDLSGAVTSSEAIKLAGLDWRVEGKPIFTQDGLEIPNYKANTRSSDNKVLGIVTDRYKVVQNDEAFAFTDSLIGTGDVKYETAGSLNGGKRIWLLAKMPQTQILDDKIDPYLCFSNVHDGTGSVKVCMTPLRVICQNTLNLALKNATRKWSTVHAGNIETKLTEARYTLHLANAYMNELNLEAERLAATKMTDAEFEGYFDALMPINPLEDTQRKIKNIVDMKEKLFNCLRANDIRIYQGTMYYYLQAVTDFVAHSTPVRFSPSYRENNWQRIMDGHPLLDGMYNKMLAR